MSRLLACVGDGEDKSSVRWWHAIFINVFLEMASHLIFEIQLDYFHG